MVAPAAGAVVLVRFPFSDLSQTRLHPAVILADAGRGSTGSPRAAIIQGFNSRTLLLRTLDGARCRQCPTSRGTHLAFLRLAARLGTPTIALTKAIGTR